MCYEQQNKLPALKERYITAQGEMKCNPVLREHDKIKCNHVL